MKTSIIDRELSSKILMAGNYYLHGHPGGISALVQYWSQEIDGLQYYPTYRLSNIMVRTWQFATSYVRLALRLMFDKKIRILHLHAAADGSFWRKTKLLALGKFFGQKVILHIHASRFKNFYEESSAKKKCWIRNMLNLADCVIALSESWREWFVGIGVTSDKIAVLHNITAIPAPDSKFEKKDGKIHYLFMGEIGERKGVFDILAALSDHHAEFEDKIEMRIGGNRNERRLRNYIKENRLESMVKFEGWVQGERKRELLNWADVFILPSYNEGLPVSILEAMSYRCPVISTPVGGIPEVVGTRKNGVLVEPGDRRAIYRAMRRYIEFPGLIKKEGNESYRIVEEYLPEAVMTHLKQIYEKLLTESSLW